MGTCEYVNADVLPARRAPTSRMRGCSKDLAHLSLPGRLWMYI